MSVTLPDITPVTVDDITQGSVTGTGIFDKLMATVAAQLQAEFQADRITKSDYGQVYVSALNNTLGQAIQFLLTKDQAALQAATLAAQYEKIALEKDILELQKQQLTLQLAHLEQQTLLIQSQILTDAAQRALINQKIVTEVAQTQDTPTSNTSTGYSGVVGKQNALYAAQTTGFTRDAEQKAAKLALDILATQLSTDDSMTVANTNMHPAAIGALVEKLATGIGVTLPSA
jgi:hypothetical protein